MQLRNVANAVEPVLTNVPRPYASQANELVDGAFSFAEQLLKNQHDFVTKLLSATSPNESKSAPASKKSTASA